MDTTDMVEPVQDVQVEQENMDKHKRYYILHREEANARRLIRYHNNPKVIAKKEEREHKRGERELEKELKKQAMLLERVIKREEARQHALATKKKIHPDEEKINENV